MATQRTQGHKGKERNHRHCTDDTSYYGGRVLYEVPHFYFTTLIASVAITIIDVGEVENIKSVGLTADSMAVEEEFYRANESSLSLIVIIEAVASLVGSGAIRLVNIGHSSLRSVVIGTSTCFAKCITSERLSIFQVSDMAIVA